MARLGRRRISKFSLLAAVLLGVAVCIVLWAYSRPLPEYLVAKSNLGHGAEINPTNLEVVQLDLGEASELYLKPSDLSAGLIVNRTVGEGELIPRSGIASAVRIGYSIISLTPAQLPSDRIAPGDLVQIWTVPQLQNSAWEPAQILGIAEVVAITPPEGVFASDTGVYELLVPSENLTPILEGIAKGNPIFLVLGGV